MASPQTGWTIGIVAGAALLVGGPAAGGLISVLGVRAAYASTATAPPAEKAKVLAEGISAAMNYAAIGLVVALIGTAVLIGSVVGLLTSRRSASVGQD